MMLLEGKTGLIVGLSDRHGFAWAIAQALAAAGARLILSHEPRHARRAPDLAAALDGAAAVQMDVGDDAEIAAAFEQIGAANDGLDFLIHAVAFAPPQAMMGRFVDTARDDFRLTLDVSAYSLVALARAAEPLFTQRGGGSVVALTYYGAEKAVLGYRVMGVAKAALEASVRYLAGELGTDGIRVNAISAGPARTISARGIPGFMDLYRQYPERAPLRRHIETSDVGNTALYLCSDLARSVTGEVIHVDSGYHAMGM
jgi:enoyl-[acyl-carrier protein] reductase I